MKRVLPLLLVLVLLIGVFAVSAYAADDPMVRAQEIMDAAAALQGTFPTSADDPNYDGFEAVCPSCGTSQTWKPLTTYKGENVATGDHYYMPKSFSSSYQIFTIQSKKKVCLHTNGMNITTKSRICTLTGGSTLNVMGTGSLSSTGASTSSYGVLYTNEGTYNIYGATIKSTGTTGLAGVAAYKFSTGKINVYGGTIEAGTNPAFETGGGYISLYNTTVTGATATMTKDGNYTPKLTVSNSSIPGVDVKTGTVTLSGAAQIGGEGLTLYDGNKVTISGGLSEGASVLIRAEGVFTANAMADYAKYFASAEPGYEVTVNADGALQCTPKGAELVLPDGSVASAADVLEAWKTGAYAYIRLRGDQVFEDLGGAEVCVDLAGYELTVNGTGTVCAFDTANDTYDAEACGSIVAGDDIQIVADVAAPNGNRYVAVTGEGSTSMHRMSAYVTSVTLRTAATGLYYNAKYECDDVLAAMVKTYGVVLSVNNMPGSDFLNESGKDINLYTEATVPFESGATATSGAVFGIMKAEREAEENSACGQMKIYANAYIRFQMDDLVAVGDVANAGKKDGDEGYTGIGYSLRDVMMELDSKYYDCEKKTQIQLDLFYDGWKKDGMDWTYENIDPTYTVDNSDLVFEEGTTNAYCPVCKKVVTWTALDTADAKVTLANKQHMYLTKSLTCTLTYSNITAFIIGPSGGSSACLHLNGFDITATKAHAFYSSGGVLNVMGNGTVTGYTNTSTHGGAISTNTNTKTTQINLYGGTYKRHSGSASGAYVLALRNNGGCIKVYKDVVVDGEGGNAIRIGTSTLRNSVLEIYGATVLGKLYSAGADASKGFATNVTLKDADITVSAEFDATDNVSMSGRITIGKLIIPKGLLITFTDLKKNTSIGVSATGAFTGAFDDAENFLPYFYTQTEGQAISVVDGALYQGAVATEE